MVYLANDLLDVIALYLVFGRFLRRSRYRSHPEGGSNRAGHVRSGPEAQPHAIWMVDHPRFHECVVVFVICCDLTPMIRF